MIDDSIAGAPGAHCLNLEKFVWFLQLDIVTFANFANVTARSIASLTNENSL